MRSRRNTLVHLLALLALAMLIVRGAGGHLHFCFDGSEPPVSMHTLDTEAHHEAGSSHDDQDVQLPSATLGKQTSQLDDSALLFAFFVGFLITASLVSFSRERRYRPPAVIALLIPLPPLRGPPSAFNTF
jgi:hypothetical protein